MRRLRMLAGTMLFAALLAACGGGSPKLARLPPDAVILAFGDSLTFGTGANAQDSYPAVLERIAARKVVSAGVPGEISAAGLARLTPLLDELKPALLVLCHGGNDFLRKLDEREAAKNVRAMAEAARARGIAVVLVATPKPGLMPSPPGFYADIAHDLKLPFDDVALKKILTDNELKSDLVHPNAKGYARMAQAVADLLKASGAL
jgi:lysophospholipase L1-like esterase